MVQACWGTGSFCAGCLKASGELQIWRACAALCSRRAARKGAASSARRHSAAPVAGTAEGHIVRDVHRGRYALLRLSAVLWLERTLAEYHILISLM